MCKLIIFIFAKRNIKIETDLVKSDNVPTQYINKCAFYLLQQKVNKFNDAFMRIYAAVGHSKRLIDTISSFVVKGLLRRDIIRTDERFCNSADMQLS